MPIQGDPLLSVVLNLARFHREHEKFYAESPLHDAITLQRGSSALKALAERWSVVVVQDDPLPSPFAGATDLNDDRATETLGILFMEGQGEPAEITRLKADLGGLADAYRSTDGAWVQARPFFAAGAKGAPTLVVRTSASMATLAARNIDRSLAILARVDFAPAVLRADLAGERIAPRYLFSTSEMLDHAADLAAQSAILTHENERRWRVFHQRVQQLSQTRG